MKQLLLIVMLSLACLSIIAQENIQPNTTKTAGTTKPSKVETLKCKGLVNPPSSDLKWRPLLTNKYEEFEPQSPNQKLIDSIKAEKLKLKQSGLERRKNYDNIQSVTPVIGVNFPANIANGSSPLDNSMAISNGGIIVTLANTTIEYYDSTGTNTYYQTLLAFANSVDASITGVCDPVVLYDAGVDRFIFFFQQSPLTANSKIFIFFSQTNNPANGWWSYEFAGDPTGNGDAFDYPKLGVSTSELFIAGNLFSEPSDVFHQAVVYQIDKTAGYSGGSVNDDYYTGITGSPFTILPVSYGQSGSYGPGIYLVSTNSSGGSTINLYEVTNTIPNSPVMDYWSVSTTAYSLAGNASQFGTSCLLKTGDCRALSGFYLNGLIHFVFNSDDGSGYCCINYNRLNVSATTNQSKLCYNSGAYDYAYPSVVSYATTPTDASVMVGFGVSGAAIYPEEVVVNCDNTMNWSTNAVIVQSGQGYVSYTSTTAERWGDYTGTSRRHNSIHPCIWMSGMFGTASNQWDTWIAQIYDATYTGINNISTASTTKVYPNPIIDMFKVEFTLTESIDLQMNIEDINGKVVKELYTGTGNAGDNVFSFNKANLSAGIYFLIIKSNSQIIKSEKIVITN
ncbi:MAG TPA: T9SS type A sorting domain-containing protein [Bacteroidia bacterium]|jgi:hypothetical protein|nr:T9SS type A sorting domain-containing protein [Bacteroidia bacterium]